MVLVQNENRSYNFLPKLIIGSFFTSFLFVILWQLIESHQGNYSFINKKIINNFYEKSIINQPWYC